MLKSLQPCQTAMIDLDDLLVIKGRIYTLWNSYIWECPATRNNEWTRLRRIERYDRGFKVILDLADKIQEKDISWRSCAPISHVEMAQLWKP